VLPLGLIYLSYLAVFWHASGPIAQPARAVRSINNPEGRDISSNLYRMLERANIRLNVKDHPITGLGFGQPYVFYYGMPDLSWWMFYHYTPHNGVMFLWMNMGPLGFITFLSLIGAGMVRGIHVLKRLGNDHSAPFLVALVCYPLLFIVFSYADIGIMSTRLTAVLGLALGVIGMWGKEVSEASDTSVASGTITLAQVSPIWHPQRPIPIGGSPCE
jgi:hypothetical protein